MIADYIKDVTADWEHIYFQTHMQLELSLSLEFNCTSYLSAGADHNASGSLSCLCWRLIPLYTPHFPRCPSDHVECQQLRASGLCINYMKWGGHSEWGADSISVCGEGKEDGEFSAGRQSRGQWKDTGRRAKADCKSPQDKEEILKIAREGNEKFNVESYRGFTKINFTVCIKLIIRLIKDHIDASLHKHWSSETALAGFHKSLHEVVHRMKSKRLQ